MSSASPRRALSPVDRLLEVAQRGLAVALDPAPSGARSNPAGRDADLPMDRIDTAHASGLMRVNHAGEVAAQALYHGQAAFARDPAVKRHMLEAAAEEQDHLAWCAARLDELGSRPSRLGPAWYAGSYAIGALAAAVSDRVSLGFVAETEAQVERHLGEHLESLPGGDQRSRAIVRQMQADEAAHGAAAREAGGAPLPRPVKHAMRATARVMKSLAYWV